MNEYDLTKFIEFVVAHPITVYGVTLYPRVGYDSTHATVVVILYLPGEVVRELKPAELTSLEEAIDWYKSLFNVEDNCI